MLFLNFLCVCSVFYHSFLAVDLLLSPRDLWPCSGTRHQQAVVQPAAQAHSAPSLGVLNSSDGFWQLQLLVASTGIAEREQLCQVWQPEGFSGVRGMDSKGPLF